MTEQSFHFWVTVGVVALGFVTFLLLLFVSAPYGRHTRKGWGPSIPSRLGWIVMESPPVLAFALFFWWGPQRTQLVPLVLLGLWQLHYIHRAYIFPWRMRIKGKTMPLVIACLAILFNIPNAYINARWLSSGWGGYTEAWLTDPRFIIGCSLFLVGFAINIQSDTILLNLRKPGETGYKIPHGGMYRFISCPNYFGEILEWTGWAIATWSLPGLAFAVYTFANLAPRAFTHHKWYQDTFPEYPTERKALFPYLL